MYGLTIVSNIKRNINGDRMCSEYKVNIILGFWLGLKPKLESNSVEENVSDQLADRYGAYSSIQTFNGKINTNSNCSGCSTD